MPSTPSGGAHLAQLGAQATAPLESMHAFAKSGAAPQTVLAVRRYGVPVQEEEALGLLRYDLQYDLGPEEATAAAASPPGGGAAAEGGGRPRSLFAGRAGRQPAEPLLGLAALPPDAQVRGACLRAGQHAACRTELRPSAAT